MKSNSLSVAFVSSCLAVFCLLLCARKAQAETAQNHASAVRILDSSEDILRAGTIITAKVTDIKNGTLDDASSAWERCYISGNKIRVDTISDCPNDAAAGRAVVTVQILSPKYTLSGQVVPDGIMRKCDYTDAEALFSRLITNPPLEIRAAQGAQSIAAELPQVLGFNGTRWLGDMLKVDTDGSVTGVGDTEVVKFGANTDLLTKITLRTGSGLPEGYSYTPNDGNKWFKMFKVARFPSSSKGRPAYCTNIVSSSGDTHYQLQIVDLKSQSIPDSVFQYADVISSPYVRHGGK